MIERPPRACPACTSEASAAEGRKNGHDLRLCRRCKSLFTAQLPGAGAAESYGGYYHEANLEVPPLVHRRLDALVADHERYRRENRWLDIGCGAGALVQAVARAGWHVEGTEVAPQPVARMRARGFKVHLGDVLDMELPEEAYDVITLIEVLEHVPDPRALVARAATLLRPGGLLYLTTPHARGISSRLLGLRWSVVAPPEHLQLFSLAGLDALVWSSSLTRQDVRVDAVNPYELLAALRSPTGQSGGPGRVRTSYRLNETLHSRRAGVLLKRGVNAVLDATELGDALKYRATRPSH